jgi:hypothetical protein
MIARVDRLDSRAFLSAGQQATWTMLRHFTEASSRLRLGSLSRR